MSYSSGLRGLLLAAFTTLAGCGKSEPEPPPVRPQQQQQQQQRPQPQQSNVVDLGLDGNHQFTVLAAPNDSNIYALMILHSNLEKMDEKNIEHIILKTHPLDQLVPDDLGFAPQGSGESTTDFLNRASTFLDDLAAEAEALKDVKSLEDLKKITGNAQADKVVRLVEAVGSDAKYGEDFYKSLAPSLKKEVQKYKGVVQRRKTLEEFYANPNNDNKQKLRDLSHFIFQSDNLGSNENSTKYAALLVDLIIKAQEKGIEVHFAGDTVGAPTSVMDAQSAYKKHVKGFSKFIQKNPDLKVHLTALAQLNGIMGIDDYLASLNLDEDKHKDLKDRIEKFRLLESGDANGQSGALTERFSEDAEKTRAAELVRLAGGKRAIIVWDPAHFFKSPGGNSGLPHGKDVNEFIDEALIAQRPPPFVLPAGATPPPTSTFEPTKVIEVYKTEKDFRIARSSYGGLYTDEPDNRFFGDKHMISEPE